MTSSALRRRLRTWACSTVWLGCGAERMVDLDLSWRLLERIEGVAVTTAVVEYLDELDAAGVPEQARLIGALVCHGDAETVAGQLRAHLGAGADHVAI
jgi:hypothetical protein